MSSKMLKSTFRIKQARAAAAAVLSESQQAHSSCLQYKANVVSHSFPLQGRIIHHTLCCPYYFSQIEEELYL